MYDTANAPLLSWLLTLVEVSAVLAFALSGLLEAARKKLDAVGVCLVAGLAAFGGGTLRATASGLRLVALITGYTLPRWSSGGDVS